jgi:hypothetical protein
VPPTGRRLAAGPCREPLELTAVPGTGADGEVQQGPASAESGRSDATIGLREGDHASTVGA